jgi:hypothetical protein
MILLLYGMCAALNKQKKKKNKNKTSNSKGGGGGLDWNVARICGLQNK